MKLKFKEWELETKWGQYNNGLIALQLLGIHPEDGYQSVFATATVNLWDPVPPDTIWDKETQIWVKDYSENEGMYDALIASGIIKDNPTPMLWPCGFTHGKLGNLTAKALMELQRSKQEG